MSWLGDGKAEEKNNIFYVKGVIEIERRIYGISLRTCKGKYIKKFTTFLLKVLEIFRICAIIITELALRPNEC